MRLKCILSAAVAATFCMTSLHAAVILDEDFDGYTDTADLGTVWSLGDGTLDTVNGNPGQSLDHPGTGASFGGGNTNSFSFTEFVPTADEKLLFSADIFDDATSANKRTTAGIRRASGANLIEMGMYNSPSHYAYRAILFGPGDPSWVAFDNMVDDSGSPITNAPVQGWHTFSALVSPSEIVYTLDLNGDGNINATATVPISPVDLGFDIVRLGGPSDLSSGGGGVKFDNILVETVRVPEPSTIALCGLAMLGLAARKRLA